MNQKDRCKGRKGSLGKKTDALDPDEHFDVIALMLEPPASCCVCLCVWGRGCWSRYFEKHAVSTGNMFVICYIR
jgi:hypothetical protein